jgi:hypothetical protein
VTVNPDTSLRDIEEMQMRSAEYVRPRINEKLVAERIAPIRIPMLVMGRDDDHLQGIFRVSYDVLAEAGKDVEWASWDHPRTATSSRWATPSTRPRSGRRRRRRVPRQAPRLANAHQLTAMYFDSR